MTVEPLRVIGGREIAQSLEGRREEVMIAVREAYAAFGAGRASLPQSSFLRFPGKTTDRIIALPAFLGQPFDVAGLKWISSFPGNLGQGVDRASAVQILNELETGRPYAILEASIISAKRTAASAALAAQLCARQAPRRIGLIGCGYINFEVLGFLLHCADEIQEVLLFDLDESRSRQFAARAGQEYSSVVFICCGDATGPLAGADIVSFATTASSPHVQDRAGFKPGSIVLNISLRDLAPEVVLASDNLVDSTSHVCREHTSIHLAAQAAGNTDFITAEIHELIGDPALLDRFNSDVLIFSPFGLGVLDLAVAKLVVDDKRHPDAGDAIDGFFPPSWLKA